MHRNADVVRRGYEAFNHADLEALAEIFAPNASWHTPGRGSIAGDRVGQEAVFTQFGRYVGETDGTFVADLKYVAADDEGHVVALHNNRGTRGGKTLDTDCCIVFEVADGRIVSGREHFYDLAAWEDFWS